MKISEIEGFDSEKAAADTMKQNADRMKKQADAAKAKLKIKDGQQKLVKAVTPNKTS